MLVSSNNIRMKLSILVHCVTGNLWTCLALSKAKPFVIFHSEEWRAGPMSAFVRVNAFICTLALNLVTSMAFLEAFLLRRLHFLIDMGFRWLNCAPNLTVNNIFLYGFRGADSLILWMLAPLGLIFVEKTWQNIFVKNLIHLKPSLRCKGRHN